MHYIYVWMISWVGTHLGAVIEPFQSSRPSRSLLAALMIKVGFSDLSSISSPKQPKDGMTKPLSYTVLGLGFVSNMSLYMLSSDEILPLLSFPTLGGSGGIFFARLLGWRLAEDADFLAEDFAEDLSFEASDGRTCSVNIMLGWDWQLETHHQW